MGKQKVSFIKSKLMATKNPRSMGKKIIQDKKIKVAIQHQDKVAK